MVWAIKSWQSATSSYLIVKDGWLSSPVTQGVKLIHAARLGSTEENFGEVYGRGGAPSERGVFFVVKEEVVAW